MTHPKEAYIELKALRQTFGTSEMRVVGDILFRLMKLEDKVEELNKL